MGQVWKLLNVCSYVLDSYISKRQLHIILCCICIAVEQADDGASLHGLSVGNHHICVLLKMLVSFVIETLMNNTEWTIMLLLQDSNTVSISAKGSDDTLTGSLMDEMKSLLWLNLIILNVYYWETLIILLLYEH